MNISEAIKAMKSGKQVRRENWNNRVLYYVPKASYSAMTDIAKGYADAQGKVNYKEYIADCETIGYHCGEVGIYQPTQDDILANDWETYENI